MAPTLVVRPRDVWCVRGKYRQVSYDHFASQTEPDTKDPEKVRKFTMQVEKQCSPAECVENLLDRARGHEQSNACKCEINWHRQDGKLTINKKRNTKHETAMRKKLGLQAHEAVPPHLVRTSA